MFKITKSQKKSVKPSVCRDALSLRSDHVRYTCYYMNQTLLPGQSADGHCRRDQLSCVQNKTADREAGQVRLTNSGSDREGSQVSRLVDRAIGNDISADLVTSGQLPTMIVLRDSQIGQKLGRVVLSCNDI